MELAADISKFLSRQSQRAAYVQAAILFVIIAILDYETGYEVTFYPFYSIPILLLVWRGDLTAAMAVSIASAIAWWTTDRALGHHYSQEWLRLWDGVVRFIFFTLVVIAGASVKNRGEANRAKIELLRRTQMLEEEIIEISEREQQRIGRDLHDGFCQYLAAVNFAAAALQEKVERGAPNCAAEARQLARMIGEGVVRARELARGLTPVDRDEGGLESALEELASSTARSAGLSCSFIGQPSEILLDNDCAVDLFRIAQEAVNNAVKHARAKSVVIALETCDGELSLRISDDGMGQDFAAPKADDLGLSIMHYRARKIGAALELLENGPSGTVVSCTLDKSNAPHRAFGALQI